MEETPQHIWAERIAAYQKSGQTMTAWCTEQGLKVHQLKYWKYKGMERKKTKSTAATFRPVAIANSKSEDDSLWIQVGSARIAVRPGFEPQLLRDVVAALES
jgi:hypothetical protein